MAGVAVFCRRGLARCFLLLLAEEEADPNAVPVAAAAAAAAVVAAEKAGFVASVPTASAAAAVALASIMTSEACSAPLNPIGGNPHVGLRSDCPTAAAVVEQLRPSTPAAFSCAVAGAAALEAPLAGPGAGKLAGFAASACSACAAAHAGSPRIVDLVESGSWSAHRFHHEGNRP